MEAEVLLIQVLEEFNTPVILQGSMSEDEDYPDNFFTFWNNETEEKEHYNNINHAERANFDVNIYSNDPNVLTTKLREAKEKLKAAGFVITNAGHDVESDVETHTGKGIEVELIVKV